MSKHKTDMVGVKKMGLLWVERVRKKKKRVRNKEEQEKMEAKKPRRQTGRFPLSLPLPLKKPKSSMER